MTDTNNSDYWETQEVTEPVESLIEYTPENEENMPPPGFGSSFAPPPFLEQPQPPAVPEPVYPMVAPSEQLAYWTKLDIFKLVYPIYATSTQVEDILNLTEQIFERLIFGKAVS